MLNRFFTDYLGAHGQSGTNTKQRNLRHLFSWLEKAYGHPHPYTDELNHRYAPVRVRPSTLAQGFIGDLLEVTGGGQARGFEDARVRGRAGSRGRGGRTGGPRSGRCGWARATRGADRVGAVRNAETAG